MGAVIEEGFTIEAATGIEIGMVTDGGEVEVETGTGIHVGDEVGVEVGVVAGIDIEIDDLNGIGVVGREIIIVGEMTM